MEAVADVCQQLFGIAPGAMLLVCLLVFLAGYVDAIAGGGGLISLPAYMIAGLPTHAAIATNKMSSTMGTTIATCEIGLHPVEVGGRLCDACRSRIDHRVESGPHHQRRIPTRVPAGGAADHGHLRHEVEELR